MGIFREIPPTAGFPLYARDFLSWLKISDYRRDNLEDDFKNYLGINYVRITYSGTVAFYIILESLKELSNRRTVVIPSYICPLLPLAIQRAGLKVEVCDIGPDDFNFNFKELSKICAQDDILAIVPAYLGGIPLDFTAIEQIAEKYGIFIIEDCAQSLGAEYQGKKTGTLGDFSFFSLCRGKGLTIYEGGAIVTTKEEYVKIIDHKTRELIKDDFFSEAVKIWELFGYWLFYRPRLFWFVFRLPQIFWNLQGRSLKAMIEDFNVDFPMHQVSVLRKLIGHVGFFRLEEQINQQRQKAKLYLQRFADLKGIKVIQEAPSDRATYPYLTLLFEDQDKRNLALKIFSKSNQGISIIYALAITDYPYLKDFVPQRGTPGGRSLAARQLTLSTNTFLESKDMDCVLDKIKVLCR